MKTSNVLLATVWDKIEIVLSESTHIRILAFSPAGIKDCAIQIGDFKKTCKQIKDNFFVVPWDPKRYQNGLHYLIVTVTDKADRVNQIVQPFGFDDQQSMNFDFFAVFVLKTDATTILKGLFYMSTIICVAPLIFLRIWHELVKGKRQQYFIIQIHIISCKKC